jgi:DNA helicase II / ATP-dependent DNA helicase PcrA
VKVGGYANEEREYVLDLFPPTEQQLAVITERDTNLLVLAGPGTGKTETLARRFAALVADGLQAHQILVLTFSRRAAEEMRQRVLLRLRQLHRSPLAVSELFVKTFHSFCGRLLEGEASRSLDRALLTPVKERLLWRRLLQSGEIRLQSFGPDVVCSSQFAVDCLNVIGQLKGRGLRPERFSNLAQNDWRLRDLALIYEHMEAERLRLGLHDYRDLVNEAEQELRNQRSGAAAWLRRVSFRHVLVDEFQDSDPMQLQLLDAIRAVIDPQPCFCFVGDKNQSIYRFRGAAPRNVDVARERFSCKTLVLHKNRRSAPAILAVANADPKLDPASKTEAADLHKQGLARFVRSRSIETEVRFIRDAIVEKIASGTPARAIAVLLRQTRPYQELIISLVREAGIPVAAQPTAGFHQDGLINAVRTALDLLQLPHDIEVWRRLLENPIVGYRPVDVRFSFDAGRRQGISDPVAMLASFPPRGVRPGLRSIHKFLDAWRECERAYRRSTTVELVETIVSELDLLSPVRESAGVPGFDVAASPARLRLLLQAAKDYEDLARADHRSSQTIADFAERFDETIGLLADSNAPPPATAEGVRVISIHAAKGLEFDFVIIPQLIDGVFPASVRPTRPLPERSIRKMRQSGADIFVDDDEARVEEHALWYVALTRARNEVLATAPEVDDDGVELQVSSFALAVPKMQDMPPDVESARVSVLQAVSDHPTQDGEPKIDLPIETLSPTSIGTFVTCPRRFYYAHVLRLPRREDDATYYGLRLHSILRRFHEVETDFDHIDDPLVSASRYERTMRRIIVEEEGFEEGGLGPLARFEREDMEQRLCEYVHRLTDEAANTGFRVLACEQQVQASFAGLTVRGKADRVDRLVSGELVIRDYKSGRLHAPLATALRGAFEQLDKGFVLFGDAPEGLNLQLILYVPGVEQLFGAPVRRVDYIYFRGKGIDDSRLRFDRTEIVDSHAPSQEPGVLSRYDIARSQRDIAARIVELCRSGEMAAFATTRDEQICLYCDFKRICPGAGSIPA